MESNNMEVQNRKRKSRRNSSEFLGWGSKPLIEFLQSIGKESRQYSQLEVETMVKEYASSNNLIDPKNKRIFVCDEQLFKLFRKRTVSRMKVYKLLEVHFIENHYESDEGSSEEDRGGEEEEERVSSRKTMEKKAAAACKKKDVQKAPRSCFAALTAQNIKLIFLKRSLVLDLLKDNPESFEEKIVGSIVRISSDVNYYFSKHSFQLQQVTGVRRSSGSGNSALETCLRLSNVMADVPISKLTDRNFSEEECEEFQEHVKAGMVKRPTVEEFELKAQALHMILTKHWIEREISFLQSCINNMNEKGRRGEMFECMKRRELLLTSTEQERLLSQKPEVAAEEPEHEETPMAASEEVEEEEEDDDDEDSCLPMKKLKAVAEEPEPEATLMGASDMSAAGMGLAEGDNAGTGAGNVAAMQPYYPGRQNSLGAYSAVLENKIAGMQPNYPGEMCWHGGIAQAQLLQQPPLGGFSALLRNVTVQAQLEQPPLGGHSALLRNVMAQAHLQQPHIPGNGALLGNVGEDPNAAICHGVNEESS